MTVIARDLTERRRSDEQLRLSEERFYKIFQSNPSCITITRLSDDTFVDVNDRFLAASGFSRIEVVGHTGVELGLWPDPAARRRLDDAIRSGQPVRDIEVTLTRKSGRPLELRMTLEAFSVGGEPCVFAISDDVTEKKQLEQQLRQAQKMEAIGRLAGGIAHDFNNLLTAIRGYSQLLMEQLPQPSLEQKAATHIHRSALRASSLTEQLLVFTRRRPSQPRVLALGESVRAAAALFRRVLGEDIEVELKLDPGPLRVRADPTQLEQVLLNLAVNARDAMPAGGRLTVETAAEDGQARLTVRDTGVGMSDETRQHIFEPFFTTKEVGQGTGLGLAIVYGVVTQSGGTIAVESAPGAGTAIHIRLPAVSEPVDPELAKVAARAPAQRGHETILLVEDDEDVRDFVEFVLRQAGYRVLSAIDGASAIERARVHEGEIDLLLSDVIMPQIDGLRLVEHLAPLRPRMKVLHMSGYPGDRISSRGTPAGGEFLQKPFSSTELTTAVRRILDEK